MGGQPPPPPKAMQQPPPPPGPHPNHALGGMPYDPKYLGQMPMGGVPGKTAKVPPPSTPLAQLPPGQVPPALPH